MMAAEKMNICIVDPIDYPYWDRLVSHNTDYSFFHTSTWAKTLVTSYRFKPFYFHVLEEDRFSFLMPIMEVDSFLTGKRGVSLPFTDQCRSLTLNQELFTHAVQSAIRLGEKRRWRYIEWRDAGPFEDQLPASEQFYVHDIGLAKAEDDLFLSLSDNNRRNIKKANREGVVVSIEKSLGAVEEFYRLNLITRKRHGLPPQPVVFFRNVFEHILSRDFGIVALASYAGRIIAASVFFHFGKKAIYKYGASEATHLHLRPNNQIMWEALKWYNERGFETMNLGRTEINNPGLLQFKRTWGAKERLIKYHLYDIKKRSYVPIRPRNSARFEKLFSRLPASALRIIGQVIYKHVG